MRALMGLKDYRMPICPQRVKVVIEMKTNSTVYAHLILPKFMYILFPVLVLCEIGCQETKRKKNMLYSF